jgi:lipopolysaccharide export system permease protein
MRLISRHILQALAAPFLWGLAALTGLLLLNQLAPLIDQFGGKGLQAGVIIEAVLLTLPALLALSLPMAVLVSTLYGFSQLASDLELVAMYATGISVWRMTRPALLAALGVALVNFLLYDQVVPRSNTRFSALQTAVFNKMPTLSLRPQVLNPLPPNVVKYVLKAASIDPVTGAMTAVQIYDLSAVDARSIIVADSGRMAKSPSGTDLLLTLYHGEALEYEQSDPGRLQRTVFATDRVRIRNVTNQLQTASPIDNRSDNRSMTGCELLDARDAMRHQHAMEIEYAEYYTRQDLHFLNGLTAPARPEMHLDSLPPHCGVFRKAETWFRQLMLPRDLHAQSTPPGQHPAQVPPMAQQPAPQQPVRPPSAPAGTGNPALTPGGFLVPPFVPRPGDDGLPTKAAVAAQATRMAANYHIQMLGYAVEFHKKFAIPLGSICFVLLGVALALKYPRGGIGLVIGASLVIFLGFYILLIGGENVAKKGYVSPALAIQGPLILFTTMGLLAVQAANREMGSVRSGGVFQSLRGLLRRLWSRG